MFEFVLKKVVCLHSKVIQNIVKDFEDVEDDEDCVRKTAKRIESLLLSFTNFSSAEAIHLQLTFFFSLVWGMDVE